MGDIDGSLYELKEQVGADVVRMQMNAWEILAISLKGKIDRDVLLRIPFPSAAWIALQHNDSPWTTAAAIELLLKLDTIRVRFTDDPMQKALEIKRHARHLRSYTDLQDLDESFLISKSHHILPAEYDVQKQMIEGRHDGLSRDAVLTTL